MLFPTAEYALFFLCVFAASWALRTRHFAHKSLLLAASWLFYAWWDWRFLPLLAAISGLAVLVARSVQRLAPGRLRITLLTGGIALSLATLAFFKYFAFAATSVVEALGAVGLDLGPVRLPEVVLPVGISFFVFQGISLMVDAYRGHLDETLNPLDGLLYIAFFPQLVAGPILRAGTLLPQFTAPPDPHAIDASRAVLLIVTGLVKKVVVANFLATRLVDAVFESPGAHGGLETLLAIYGYAAQIYCDFSGYTDIAIGSALLLGYSFGDNFDAPYRALSPRDFWRRWHISLSQWLRDYLFVPLGGSRHGRRRTLVNLAVTMLLGGLWHGAAWTFVAWGALHGAGLVAHRLWTDATFEPIRRLRASRAWRPVAWLLTFHFVCLGWVFFRAPTLEAAGELLAALGRNWSLTPSVSVAVVLAIAAGLFGQFAPPEPIAALRVRFARLPLAAQGLVLAAAMLLIDAMGPQGVAPFIYFQF